MKTLFTEIKNDFKTFKTYQKVAFLTMCAFALCVCGLGLSLLVAMFTNGISGNNIPFL